jgi:tetratricopeptide (TPR) repeat protein
LKVVALRVIVGDWLESDAVGAESFARSCAVIRSDRPPYSVLRPFEPSESHLFFGRDGCVDQMVARLAERRFLAVLGSSGTGKSSLVKTGLFSALEMGLLPRAGSRWLIVEMRPGGNPLGHLARALLEAPAVASNKLPPPDPGAVVALETQFKREGSRALIMWCREGHLPEQTNLLIVVDQFEELFRYQSDDGREDAKAFVSLLLESRWPRGAESPRAAALPIYVAITMRSEYLGACALIEGLAEAVNEGTYLTPRMKRRELEEAIVGPARVSGVEIEPRLVTRILNDLADFAPWDEGESKDQLSRLARRADQLPLMQHALNRVWQRARERHGTGKEVTLTLDDYHGLEQELDDHAEQVLQSLRPAERAVAERVFRAVTFGTTAADAIRRPTKYGDLIKICGAASADAVAAVLAAFGPRGAQFLTSDIRQTGDRLPEEAWIDIAHESLIRQWKTLSGWLEKEGRAANEWRRLRDNVEREEVLRGRALRDAIAFRRTGPTDAWAERYGGGYSKVIGLINKSEWRKRARMAIGAACLAAVVIPSYLYYQRIQQAVAAHHQAVAAHHEAVVAKRAATENFELAVKSAQRLLNQVRDSLDNGDLRVNGANDMLKVASSIAGNAHLTDPTVEITELLIRLQHSFSDIYGELGNIDLAFQDAKKAKEIAESLLVENRDDPKLMQLIYASLWRMGDYMLYQGEDRILYPSRDRATQQKALSQYLEAQGFAQRLAEQAPEDGARQRELMFIGQKIGDVQQAVGDLDAAIATYRTAFDVIEKVAAREPKNRSWRRDAANARRRIGQALVAKGDTSAAMDELKAALDVLDRLAFEDRKDNVVKSNLAANHRDLADAYARGGDLPNASAEYELAVAKQEQLVASDPHNATSLNSLAVYNAGAGRILQRQNDLPHALDRYRKAYALRQELARKDPTNPGRQNTLAKAGIAVADVLVAQKDKLEEAVKFYREAIDIQDEVRPRHDDDVFGCYIKIGDIRLLQEDRDGALTEYTRAWAIANNIVADNRTSVAWQRRLTNSYIKIGDLLVTIDRSAEARAQYQEALKIVTDLAAKNPQSAEWLGLVESLKTKIQGIRA